MNKLKKLLRNNPITHRLYQKLKNKKEAKLVAARYKGKYSFENRSKGYSKACIVLIGYKPFLYDAFFSRFCRFLEPNIDVLLVSSGLYSEQVSEIAKKKGFSYLSTKRNNVCLALNIGIHLFEQALFFYKIDEDIFLTKGFFSQLSFTYDQLSKEGIISPGFVASLIPINGYCYAKVLEKTNTTDDYQKQFGKIIFGAGHDKPIESDPKVAKFFWGEGDHFPKIDKINEKLSKDPFAYSMSPVRFSIGAIYFSKDFIKRIKYLSISKSSNDFGMDEQQLCEACVNLSCPMVISENSLVGHLGFGPQNSIMKQYFLDHPERF